jgi:hypothetical protein
MKKNAIIFIHHNTNEIAKHNLELIKKFNPDCDVFTVGFSWHNLFPDSHIVYRTEDWPVNYRLNNILNCGTSSESDLYIYDFFMHHQEYESYFVVEWDTYCNTSIQDFYGDAMKKYQTFSAFIFTNKPDLPDADKTKLKYVKEWSWFGYFDQLKSDSEKKQLIPYLGGTYPTSLLFYRNNVLHDMMTILLNNPRLYDNIQNEMRLGTLIQSAGYELIEHGGETNQFFEQPHYKEYISKQIKGYYHPIKEIL